MGYVWKRRSIEAGAPPLASPGRRPASIAFRRDPQFAAPVARRAASQNFTPAQLGSPIRINHPPVPGPPLPSLVSVWDDFLAEAELTFDEGSSPARPSPKPYRPPPPPRTTSLRPGWEPNFVFPTPERKNSNATLRPPSPSRDDGDMSTLSHSTSILSLSAFPSPPLAGASVFSSSPSSLVPSSAANPISLAQRRARCIPALILTSTHSSASSQRHRRRSSSLDVNHSYFSPASPSLSPTPFSSSPESPPRLQGLGLDLPPTHFTSEASLASSSSDPHSPGRLTHPLPVVDSAFSPTCSTPSLTTASPVSSTGYSDASSRFSEAMVAGARAERERSVEEGDFNGARFGLGGSFGPGFGFDASSLKDGPGGAYWAWEEWEELRRSAGSEASAGGKEGVGAGKREGYKQKRREMVVMFDGDGRDPQELEHGLELEIEYGFAI